MPGLYYEEGSNVSDGEETPNDMSSLQLHARMLALAKLAKSDVYGVLRAIPDIYALAPDSVRELRDRTLKFLRTNLDKEVQKPSVKSVYDEVVSGNPDFMKEFLESYVMSPLLGH